MNELVMFQNMNLAPSVPMVLNIGVDLSSSMEEHKNTFPEKYRLFLDALSASPASQQIRLRVYEVSGFTRKLRDASCKKICDLSLPGVVPRYTSEQFQKERFGGILRAGSPLKDGLARLADRSLTDRHDEGHCGPLMLGLFADGYDRGSEASDEDVQRKLQLCRKAKIGIQVVFFVPYNNVALIKRFVKDVGLEEGEFSIIQYNSIMESKLAIDDAFEEMSESIINQTRRF
jgi:hypothetical protein